MRASRPSVAVSSRYMAGAQPISSRKTRSPLSLSRRMLGRVCLWMRTLARSLWAKQEEAVRVARM